MPLAPRGIMEKWRTGSLRSWPHRLKALSAGAIAKPALSASRRHPNFVAKFAAQAGQATRIYGAIGPLEVRLASTRAELRAAQRLRYQVFYEEMSATPSMTALVRRRDEDPYDPLCDHLLVVDRGCRTPTPSPQRGLSRLGWRRSHRPLADPIVGTYRILRQEIAERHDGFYSQSEYNVAPLLAAKSDLEFMELGRSCVLPSHRTKRTVELLWHGLWTYIREHGVDVMIGCASFEGIDPDAHAMALSFLHHHALAPPEWRVRAHESLWIDMNRLAADRIDAKAALKALPPLIKGYLRLGAYFGDGAVVDAKFGTTDVLVILPVERIDPRYFARFGAPDELTSRIGPEARGMM